MTWAWWRPPCLYRQVIVNFKHDDTTALRGVLWSSRGRWLTFKQVDSLAVGSPPTKLDGDIVIDRESIAFLQVL